MDICAHCRLALDAAALTDPSDGAAYHPACAVARFPQDALVALAGALVLVLAPLLIAWAG